MRIVKIGRRVVGPVVVQLLAASRTVVRHLEEAVEQLALAAAGAGREAAASHAADHVARSRFGGLGKGHFGRSVS
jgi:hypothetical protein